MQLRASYRFLAREFGQHMAHAVVAVDHRHRAGIDHELRRGHRLHHAVADAVEIPAQAQHTVRLVAPQIGLHQCVGDEMCVARRHAGVGVDGSGEIDQLGGVNAWVHGSSQKLLRDVMLVNQLKGTFKNPSHRRSTPRTRFVGWCPGC